MPEMENGYVSVSQNSLNNGFQYAIYVTNLAVGWQINL